MSMRSNNAIIKKCVVQRFGVRTPELTQFVPKSSQDDPKMAPRWPQDGPKRAPRRPQGGPKEAPRRPQVAPRWHQGTHVAPKSSRDSFQMVILRQSIYNI